MFECMLESIIYARNIYLDKENGFSRSFLQHSIPFSSNPLVFPDDFSIHLAAFHSDRLYEEHIGYWSNVYGFEMNIIAKSILADGHVMLIPADDIITSDCCIKVRSNSLIFSRKIIMIFSSDIGCLYVLERRSDIYTSIYHPGAENRFNIWFCLPFRCEFREKFN